MIAKRLAALFIILALLAPILANNVTAQTAPSYFLGGITDQGEYTERSLAKLVKLMFNEYIDPKEFINNISFYGEEGLANVKIIHKESSIYNFINLIKDINNYSKNILFIMGYDLSKVESEAKNLFEKTLNDPNKLVQILAMLYNSAMSFDSNHNYYTFFIISVGSIHWRYISRAYPKLSDDDILRDIRSFLGLEPIFIPKLKNKELQSDYALWGYKIGGLAYYIYLLQLSLWEIFGGTFDEIFKYVIAQPKNAFGDYLKKIKKALEGYSLPDDLSELGIYGVKYYITLENSIAVSYHNDYSPGYKKYVNKIIKMPLPLLLDLLGPELFVGSRLYPTANKTELVYLSILKLSDWTLGEYTPSPQPFKDLLKLRPRGESL